MGDSAVSIMSLNFPAKGRAGENRGGKFRRKSSGGGGNNNSKKKSAASTPAVQLVPSSTEADPLLSTVPENTDDSPNRYICDVCPIIAREAEEAFSTNSLEEWETHVFSGQHQSCSRTRDIVPDILERTVFVTGVLPTTTDHDIFQHFAKYGDIVNLVPHMNLSRPPPSVPCQGAMEAQQRSPRLYIIEYPFKQVADDVKRLRHVVNGAMLSVTGRQMRRHFSGGGLIMDYGMPYDNRSEDSLLLKIVKKGSTPLDQMFNLRKYIELEEREIRDRKMMADAIQTMVRKFFPGCEISLFGSSANGLGTRGCDVDLHMHFPSSPQELGLLNQTNDDEPKNAPLTTEEAKNVIAEIINSGVQHLPTPDEIVERVARILKSDSIHFEKVKAIINARVPVIKFRYKSLGMNGDLVMGSKLPVRTTELVHTLVTQDTRIRNYFFLLKYWAKREGVIGSRRGDNFNSYAFTLLIVFFLQQLDIPIIPPVCTLQNIAMARGEKEHFLDGWNANFIRENLPRVSIAVPIEQLIFDFFDFYAQFDFGLLVICPLLGQAIPRSALLDFDLLPDGLELYKSNVECGFADRLPLNTFVCLQDPFELNFNVAKNVNVRGVQNFQTKCSHYREVTAVFTEKEVNVTAIIKKLRHRLYPILDMAFGGSVASAVIMKKGVPKRILELGKTYHATVSFSMEKFHHLYPREDDPEVQGKWIRAMTNGIVDYLSRVLHMEIRDVTNVARPTPDGKSPIDYEKMAAHLGIQFDPKGIAKEAREGKGDTIMKVLYVQAYYTTWEKRKRYQMLDEFQGDRPFLDREEDITTRMLANSYPGGKPDLPRSCFVCEIRRKDNPTRLFMMMTDVSSVKRTLKAICNFMRKTMTPALHTILEGSCSSPPTLFGEPEVEMVEWSDDEDSIDNSQDVRHFDELFCDYPDNEEPSGKRKAEDDDEEEENDDAVQNGWKRRREEESTLEEEDSVETFPHKPQKVLLGWYDQGAPEPSSVQELPSMQNETATTVHEIPTTVKLEVSPDVQDIPPLSEDDDRKPQEDAEPLFTPAKEGEIPGLSDVV